MEKVFSHASLHYQMAESLFKRCSRNQKLGVFGAMSAAVVVRGLINFRQGFLFNKILIWLANFF